MMFSGRFQELGEAFESVVYGEQVSEAGALRRALEMLVQAREAKGIVYVVGNGGSAGIASHFSADLIKTCKIPSSTLYDSNLMTCLSNDYGYDQVFSYPLEHVLRPHDLLVAISSSGKSPNIIRAAEAACNQKVGLITLSGFSSENPLRKMGGLNFWVNRSNYGLVEMLHFFLLHTIVDFFGVSEYARIFGSQATKQSQNV